MSILSRLATTEMSYWGLSFVGRSWIVRKEVSTFHGLSAWLESFLFLHLVAESNL